MLNINSTQFVNPIQMEEQKKHRIPWPLTWWGMNETLWRSPIQISMKLIDRFLSPLFSFYRQLIDTSCRGMRHCYEPTWKNNKLVECCAYRVHANETQHILVYGNHATTASVNSKISSMKKKNSDLNRNTRATIKNKSKWKQMNTEYKYRECPTETIRWFMQSIRPAE